MEWQSATTILHVTPFKVVQQILQMSMTLNLQLLLVAIFIWKWSLVVVVFPESKSRKILALVSRLCKASSLWFPPHAPWKGDTRLMLIALLCFTALKFQKKSVTVDVRPTCSLLALKLMYNGHSLYLRESSYKTNISKMSNDATQNNEMSLWVFFLEFTVINLTMKMNQKVSTRCST